MNPVPDETADETGATTTPDGRPRRGIRSFVVRAGRMTVAQERAWLELWPRMGVPDGDEPLGLDALFGRRAPRTLEIGFGNGESRWPRRTRSATTSASKCTGPASAT